MPKLKNGAKRFETEINPALPLLPEEHEKFVQLVITEGMRPYKAYTAVGYKCKSSQVAKANASRLIKRDSVRARIQYLQSKVDLSQVMSKHDKLRKLEEIILNDDEESKDRLTAIRIHNQMLGHFEPFNVNVKQDIKVGVSKDTLEESKRLIAARQLLIEQGLNRLPSSQETLKNISVPIKSEVFDIEEDNGN